MKNGNSASKLTDDQSRQTFLCEFMEEIDRCTESDHNRGDKGLRPETWNGHSGQGDPA